MEGWKRKTKPPIVDRPLCSSRPITSGYLSNLRDHLYLFDVAAKKAEQLTSGDLRRSQPSWSPDGTPDRVRQRARTRIPIARTTPTSASIDAKAGRDAAAAHDVHRTGRGQARRGAPTASRSPTCRATRPRYYAYNLAKLAVIPSTGGSAALLTESLDRAVELAGVVQGRQASMYRHRRRRPRRVPRARARGGRQGRAADHGPPGRRISLSLGTDGNGAVTVGRRASAPDEVYVVENGIAAQADVAERRGCRRSRSRRSRTSPSPRRTATSSTACWRRPAERAGRQSCR